MATAQAPHAPPAAPAAASGCLSFLGTPVFAVEAWTEGDQVCVRATELDLIATAASDVLAARKLGAMIEDLFMFLAVEIGEDDLTDSERATADLISRRLGPPSMAYVRSLERDAFFSRIRHFFTKRLDWGLTQPSTQVASQPA